MEADMDASFELNWQLWHTPHLFDSGDVDLAGADSLLDYCSDLYVAPPPPDEQYGSLSGMYGGGDSGSPDGDNSCWTAAVASKNVAMERDRRNRLNEKLYALRAVVPNITKMDKASIVRDAIAYIEQLQEEERRMLAEISALESAAAAAGASAFIKTESNSIAVIGMTAGDGVTFPQRKKLKGAPPVKRDFCLATSPPLQIHEMQVSKVGEKTVMVTVMFGKARDAIAKVCRSLEPLRIKVVMASVIAVGGSIVHTMLIETDKIGGAEVKERIQAALAQLHATKR